MNLLAFGIIAEKIGASNFSLEDIKDTDSLKEKLLQQYPTLQELNYIVSVNCKIAHGNTVLDDLAEVALLPPFSGG